MTTTPTLFDGEQQVNTVETGAQFGQKVVGLADGTFVVLWTSDANIGAGSDAGRDIIGQRFDAEGNKLGGEFQANTSFFADDESLLDAKALPNGNFVLVYEDRNAAGVSYRFDILSPTGVEVDSGTILSNPGNGTNFGAASIAVAPDGSFTVAYDNGNGSTEVVRVDGAGNVGVPDIAVTHNESSSSTAITRLSNGNFVVVTEDSTPQGDAGLAFRLVDAGGNALGASTALADTRANGDSDFRPAVTALTGGGFVVSWVNIDSNDNDLQFQLFDAAGNEVGGVRTVNGGGSTDNNDDATMVALSDGGFVIGYTDDEDQSIKLQRYDASGNEVGAEATVTNAGNTTFSNSPHITLSDDGRLLVSWGFQDDAFDDNDIEVAILDPRENLIIGDNTSETITARQDGATVKGLGGNDTLLGQDSDDTISGGDGDDLIQGSFNSDSLSGDDGDDRIFAATQDNPDGSSSDDTMSGGLGEDTITGARGDDIISGGAGIDVLRGGDGDDVYFVNLHGEAIEAVNEGIDTVRSTANYALGANIENLVQLGGANLTGVGNVLDNRITGNTGANTLDGRSGDDVLTGGAGADRFVFSTAPNAAVNVDRITDFQVNVDEIRLDNAVFDALPNGALAAGAFRIGAAAADANDRVIYNAANGALIYDANGSAAGGAVRFATLDQNLALDAADFLVV